LLQAVVSAILALLSLQHTVCAILYNLAVLGRSINKFQNGIIPTVLKIGKIQNIRFVGNFILNIHTTFLDDDVIIVTSSDNRTQSICVLFSPSVCYRNSQVINSTRTTEKNEKV